MNISKIQLFCKADCLNVLKGVLPVVILCKNKVVGATAFVVGLGLLCFSLQVSAQQSPESGNIATEKYNLSQNEQQYLEGIDSLKVGYCEGKLEQNDHYNEFGFMRDSIEMILRNVGVDCKYVTFLGNQAGLELLSNNNVDIVLPCPECVPVYIENGSKPTESLIQLPFIFVANRNVDQAKALNKIAVVETFSHIQQLKADYPNSEIVFFSDIEQCYLALENGQVDRLIDSFYASEYKIESSYYNYAEIVEFTSFGQDVVFFVDENNQAPLLEILNKEINLISTNQKNSIVYKNLTLTHDRDIFRYIFSRYQNEIILSISALAAVIIVILFFIIEHNRATRQKLWQKAYMDAKTELPNLALFKKESKKIIERERSNKYCIVQFDVKKLSLINDLYGYEEGDKVILSLRDEFKKLLILNQDYLARINADVFVALISYQNRSEIDIREIFENISQRVYKTTGHFIQLSIGVYFCEQHDEMFSEINKKVIYAHKEAKKNSENTSIYEYDDYDLQKLVRQSKLEERMRIALTNGEFLTYLQPKYSAKTEQITGAEALVRWKTAEGEFIMPGEFIPLFEKNKFIVQLDLYMLENVIKTIRGWIDRKLPTCKIAVNFSLLHFEDNNFAKKIEDLIKKYDIPPNLIEIEITEATFLDRGEKTRHIISELHSIGVLVSMDDFGTGYSSLGLLKSIAVDCVKLDRSFFETSDSTRDKAKIVIESIIDLCKKLNYETVAEGIEHRGQVEYLKDLGCDTIQGYIFGKPMTIEQFEQLRS